MILNNVALSNGLVHFFIYLSDSSSTKFYGLNEQPVCCPELEATESDSHVNLCPWPPLPSKSSLLLDPQSRIVKLEDGPQVALEKYLHPQP